MLCLRLDLSYEKQYKSLDYTDNYDTKYNRQIKKHRRWLAYDS